MIVSNKEDKSLKRVLIFGIGGFVGSYLAREMMSQGYEVYGSDVVQKDIEGVTFLKADLLSAEDVEKVVAEICPEMIINLAAISSVGASWSIPQTTMSVNVVGALNIMEAARKQNCSPKVMFIGSSEEYAETDGAISEQVALDASNPYGISKMTQEKFADIYRKHYGMKIYSVRAFNHTGIGQRDSFVLPSFCKQVAAIEKSGKPGSIQVGNLSVRRDFSDARDVVRAYRMIIESDDCTKIYNVGSGTAYVLEEILQYIISLSSQPIEVEVDKNRIRPSEIMEICCDHTAITNDLGWSPKYDIKVTLKDMYQHYLRKE